jgi:hypothetical protein
MFEKAVRVTFLKQGNIFSASIPLFAEIAKVSGGFCASGECHWQKERGTMHK